MPKKKRLPLIQTLEITKSFLNKPAKL